MKMQIPSEDQHAAKATAAVKAGDVDALKAVIAERPSLLTSYIMTGEEGRTLLHTAADFPGHSPNNVAIAKYLIDAGANVNATFIGHHTETPLHWAASNDDVDLLDALLDHGADINAKGGVIPETPLADARAFLQLKTAHRLIERGADVTLNDAATLGLLDKVKDFFGQPSGVPDEERDYAFWNACHGSQLETAKYLKGRGANINVVPPWEPMTPLDVAERAKASDVIAWLEDLGAERKQNN